MLSVGMLGGHNHLEYFYHFLGDWVAVNQYVRLL